MRLKWDAFATKMVLTLRFSQDMINTNNERAACTEAIINDRNLLFKKEVTKKMNYRKANDYYYDYFPIDKRPLILSVQKENEGKFYKIPKVFFDRKGLFLHLSPEAKIIYSIARDRQELANRFNDPEPDGRRPIYLTIQETMRILNCGNKKAIKVLKELEQWRLIARIRQGLNKPCKIYVREILQTDQT